MKPTIAKRWGQIRCFREERNPNSLIKQKCLPSSDKYTNLPDKRAKLHHPVIYYSPFPRLLRAVTLRSPWRPLPGWFTVAPGPSQGDKLVCSPQSFPGHQWCHPLPPVALPSLYPASRINVRTAVSHQPLYKPLLIYSENVMGAHKAHLVMHIIINNVFWKKKERGIKLIHCIKLIHQQETVASLVSNENLLSVWFRFKIIM